MFTYKIACFSDTLLHVLQFLDVINMKDPTQKAHFYRATLREALPFIPRVMQEQQKLWKKQQYTELFNR